jgi:hypothetical protein
MATGTVQFQSATLASPPAALAVMADAVNHSALGAGTAQFVKIMTGLLGGTAGVEATEANGLEVDVTRVQGTVQTLGSVQGVGTFQVLGSVQGVGTFQALGTFQAHGTAQALGTIQTHGTSQVLGSVQGVGTFQVLGSVQPVGTAQILGTVRTLIGGTGLGEQFFGTLFTGGVTNGTLVPAPGVGTFTRVYDIMVSGSAAGTAFLEFGDGTAFAPGVFAANGGFVFNSARGVRTKAANMDILFNSAAGSWGVTVNYILET